MNSNYPEFLKNRPIFLILLAAFILYLPLIFFGYGADSDSHLVAKSAEKILADQTYNPSRNPGYFLHEICSAGLIAIGGSAASNFGTLVFSLITIFSFYGICEYYKIPHKLYLTTILAFHPLFWVNSTCTIDYLWALGLLLSGVLLFLKDRYLIAGILFGLAVGARLSSVLFVGLFFVTMYITKHAETKKFIRPAIIFAVTGAAFYIPSFIHAGNSLNFLKYHIGDWNWVDIIGRFIYKNIYFWGLQTVLLFCMISLFCVQQIRKNYQPCYRQIFILSCLVIFIHEALFLKIPVENEYLLPMLPFILILLGIALKDNLKLIIITGMTIVSYNFISVNLARPDMPDNATTVYWGIWIEWGYLISDILNRINFM